MALQRRKIQHGLRRGVLSLALLLCLVFSACVQPIEIPENEIPGEPPKICEPRAGEAIPEKLSQTGLFTDLATLTTINGFHEYDVISPLWSDNSKKRRWMWIPKDAAIGFSADADWGFPVGTCFVKQFDLELAPAAVDKKLVRVETRVLINARSGWVGYTYRWNDEQTDAMLLPDSASKTFSIQDPAASGGTRQQVWSFPSRQTCMTCHNSATGLALGVRTMQVNRDFAYAAGPENQIEHWYAQGLFKNDIGDVTQHTTLVDPSDTFKPIAARARSYLAGNCMHCHQPGVADAQGMDFRFSTALADMNIVNAVPARGNLGVTGAFRLTPGHKEESVVWLRMMSTDSFRMPTIATVLVDPVGTAVVGKWIDQLPSQ